MASPLQIGDILLITQLCFKVARAFGSGRKAAPAEFREVEHELYALANTMDLLKDAIESGAVNTLNYPDAQQGLPGTSSAAVNLAKMVENCTVTMKQFEEFIGKYTETLSGADGTGSNGRSGRKRNMKQKFIVNFKKLMWTTEEGTVQEFRNKLMIHMQGINAMVSIVNA